MYFCEILHFWSSFIVVGVYMAVQTALPETFVQIEVSRNLVYALMEFGSIIS